MKFDPVSDVKNKVCIITGGSGVIGKTIARELSKLGAKVGIVDYKKERCEKNAELLSEESGNEVFGIYADVLDKKMLLEGKDQALKKFGKIDVLINAAGGNSPKATLSHDVLSANELGDLSKTFFGLTTEGFQKVFDLNLYGTLLPSIVFGEDMLREGGSIINFSSMNSYRPLTRIPAYSAAKASINNLTQWMAVYFSKMNIRVNAISPGFLLTDQNRFLLVDEKTNSFTERGNKIISNTPMGRFGEPEEIVGTVIYLVSEQSKFVTGVIIPVDGGFNAFSGV